MRTVRDLVDAFEAFAPARWAEPWDNTGLLLGDPAAPLGDLLVTIDLTPEVIAEASRLGARTVVAYHPPIFKALKRLGPGDLAFEALRAGLAVYAPHTALDVCPGGTNDHLAGLAGLAGAEPLRVTIPGTPALGVGRVGDGPPRSIASVVDAAKRATGLERVLVASPHANLARTITRAAVCAGAGGGLLDDAIARGAELFLTGELAHHDALRAVRAGVTVISTLHSTGERLALPWLARELEARLGCAVRISSEDRDPYAFA
jgi:dinuclear metal center YbgI/SA1388 family protein